MNQSRVKKYPTIENPNDYLECITESGESAPYRFDYNNLDKAVEYLLSNGYVVIKNVLNKSEIKYGKTLLWNFLESPLIGWNKYDYNTWDINKIGGELKNGLLWGKGISHTKFQWFNRKNEKILNIFATLWNHKSFPKNSLYNNNYNKIKTHKNTKHNYKYLNNIDPNKDLLTSFSGISLFTPWYLSNKLNKFCKTNSGWYHIDHNVYKKKGLHTIQGYITYYDQNESSGSTVFIPKTHLLVQNYLRKLHPWLPDFIEIPKKNILLNSNKYKKILMCCKAGDIVLWDSRTIHCNSPALLSRNEMIKIHLNKKRKKTGYKTLDLLNELIDAFDSNGYDKIEPLRLVSMVCMVPKYRLKNEYVLKQRIDAYINKHTLTHWPNECIVLCRPNPSNVGKNQINNADDLTKSLIGLN